VLRLLAQSITGAPPRTTGPHPDPPNTRRPTGSRAGAGQEELFTLWRHHAVFVTSRFETLQAEGQHRDHAIVEQVIADAAGSVELRLVHTTTSHATNILLDMSHPPVAPPRQLQPLWWTRVLELSECPVSWAGSAA
jgi:hypothetical protein